MLDRLLAQQDLDGSGRIYQYNPLGDVAGIHNIPAPSAEPDLDGKTASNRTRHWSIISSVMPSGG